MLVRAAVDGVVVGRGGVFLSVRVVVVLCCGEIIGLCGVSLFDCFGLQ